MRTAARKDIVGRKVVAVLRGLEDAADSLTAYEGYVLLDNAVIVPLQWWEIQAIERLAKNEVNAEVDIDATRLVENVEVSDVVVSDYYPSIGISLVNGSVVIIDSPTPDTVGPCVLQFAEADYARTFRPFDWPEGTRE